MLPHLRAAGCGPEAVADAHWINTSSSVLRFCNFSALGASATLNNAQFAKL
jgi:hypothetical protein